MKLLVTGRHGQLARSLVERAADHPGVTIITTSRPEADLSVPGQLAEAIRAAKPDLVINAAAYTNVDGAEDEPELALRINSDGAAEGAQAATAIGARFIQLSTDYVFDGRAERAWREDDPVAPINAYGRSKAGGEQQVLAAQPNAIVVRTSWVVSRFGQNFVRTMLRLAADRDEIGVVADQRGCPTSASELADALIALSRRALAGEAKGIYHLAGAGEASWADLAACVMSASAECGGPSASIRPISSSDFPTRATRPAFSVLDCSHAASELGIRLGPWQPAIRAIVASIAADAKP